MINYLDTLDTTTSGLGREQRTSEPHYDRRRADLITAAESYAKRGWPVIPVHTPVADTCSCPLGKTCQSAGKHPRTARGLHDATTERAQLIAWWTDWQSANIGIVTGTASGLLVLDIDDGKGKSGSRSLAEVVRELGELPITLTAMTGTGRHLYFKHPGGIIRNSVSKIAPGIDVRADGAYVVAPPSVHTTGKRYEWVDSSVEIADLPPVWLERLIGTEQRSSMNGNDQLSRSDDAPTVHEGERNNTLYKTGCALRGQFAMSREHILPVLLDYNAIYCVPPLAEAEVVMIVNSICEHVPELGARKSARRMEQKHLYWFPFNVRDWFSNQLVMLMDDAQTGQYIRLLALAFDGGGYLTADTDQLWRLARAKTKRKFEECKWLVLGEFDTVIVDGLPMLRHPKMAALYAKALAEWMSKRAAGNESVRVKAAKRAAEQSELKAA